MLNIPKAEISTIESEFLCEIKTINRLVPAEINEDLFKSIHKKYASHGLGSINRKYIFLPYKKIFLPLYYDGNVQFLPGKTNCDSEVKKEILAYFKRF